MKILFVGGGTLGHIYPSFSVIDIIKQNGGIVYFVAGKRENEINAIKNNKQIDECYFIDVIGFKRKISLHNFSAIKKYFCAKRYCIKLLKEIKPDVVVGMGGYVSGPVLKAAIKLKLKTIIHEQNYVYGLVNRVLKNKVEKVLLSYNIDLKEGDNKILIGNPRCSEYYKKYYFYAKKKKSSRNVVLVIGGSLGASKINNYFLNNFNKFKEQKIEIILITGKKYYYENEEKIANVSYPYSVIPFVNNIYDYMIDAKLVVSRSGATTMSEIFGLKKVAIFIPSPNVSGNHQYKNAKYYYDKKCCELVLEEEIDSELFKVINELLIDNKLRKQIENNISKNVIFDSADKFYKVIESLCGDENG